MKLKELAKILNHFEAHGHGDTDVCVIDARNGACLEIRNVYESKFVDGEDKVGQPVINIC
jgi:hypothetical protein